MSAPTLKITPKKNDHIDNLYFSNHAKPLDEASMQKAKKILNIRAFSPEIMKCQQKLEILES